MKHLRHSALAIVLVACVLLSERTLLEGFYLDGGMLMSSVEVKTELCHFTPGASPIK